MKLSISYNLFDGSELLEGSIKCVRNSADYISVVYQNISNSGQNGDPNTEKYLKKLKNDGLIDEIYLYHPNISSGLHSCELTKRNIGLYLGEGAQCTHHMSMDTDEYYVTEEFKKMKEDIEINDYDSSACQMLSYYHDFETILDPPEDYYVSLIYKIRKGVTFVMGYPFPVLVDPTRRMEAGKCVTYKREQIQMHHMTGIRNDYRSKLDNSSASTNFKNEIDNLVSYYNQWEFPKKALMPGLPPKYYDVKRVKNLFQ